MQSIFWVILVSARLLYAQSASATPSLTTTIASQAVANTSSIISRTTIGLFNPCKAGSSACGRIDELTYYGSVVTADSARTTIVVNCFNNVYNITDCRGGDITVTQNRETYAYSATSGAIASFSCNITGVTQRAVCTGAARLPLPTGPGESVAETSTIRTSVTLSAADIHYNTLIITGGAEKLPSATASDTRIQITPSPTGSTTRSAASYGSSITTIVAVAPLLTALLILMS